MILQRFEPLPEAIPLQNHYDILQVEHSRAAVELRRRDRDLETCTKLARHDKLQLAVDSMGRAYYTFCLRHSQEKANQSRAIWSGIYLWLARRLGPIPSPLLETDALDDLLQVLQNGNRPLDETCTYFRLSMVRLPLAFILGVVGQITSLNAFFASTNQRWLVDNLEGPLVSYESACDKFYKEVSEPSHGNHSWQVCSSFRVFCFCPQTQSHA